MPFEREFLGSSWKGGSESVSRISAPLDAAVRKIGLVITPSGLAVRVERRGAGMR